MHVCMQEANSWAGHFSCDDHEDRGTVKTRVTDDSLM